LSSAFELAQLKESIAARLKPVAINPLSRYHPDNIAKRGQKKPLQLQPSQRHG
jgi:hypothetical protein